MCGIRTHKANEPYSLLERPVSLLASSGNNFSAGVEKIPLRRLPDKGCRAFVFLGWRRRKNIAGAFTEWRDILGGCMEDLGNPDSCECRKKACSPLAGAQAQREKATYGSPRANGSGGDSGQSGKSGSSEQAD